MPVHVVDINLPEQRFNVFLERNWHFHSPFLTVFILDRHRLGTLGRRLRSFAARYPLSSYPEALFAATMVWRIAETSVSKSKASSWRCPLMKNVGVPFTPLRTPPLKSART